MKTIAIATFLLNVSLMSPALAEKLDLATHNSLIQKLESVANLDSKDSMVMHTSLAHRLADLYAERARLLAIEDGGKGEQTYKAQIKSDRRKSILILKNIVGAIDVSEKGTVLLQMAHLHELLQEPQQAEKICRDIERNSSKYDGRTVALAHVQLGDVAFYRGSYPEAETHFKKALAIKENPRAGYSKFRLAWVHFNQMQSRLAQRELIELLQNPKMFQSTNGTVDVSFQEDVSRDLATFMAKNDIIDGDIETLQRLSPESAKKKNLIYLAEELDRTAKKKSALKVWNVVGVQAISFEEHVERQVQIAKIEYDLGHKKELLVEMDKAIELLKNPKCEKSQECIVAGQNLRRIITDWAKAEERLPSAELIIAFQKYSQSFEDYELNYWAAQSAVKRQQYREAFGFYTKAAALIHSKPQDNDALKRMHEGSLLGSIEAAELSKDADLRLKAYRQYLEMNPTGAKASEVRYQIAHWYYEKNDPAKASEEFRKLALDEKMPRDLREKSGDLCLDSDVLLKNDALVESHSLELAQNLKSKSSEYYAIWRKSVLNQSAKVINETPAPNAPEAYAKELKKLQALNLSLFSGEQRKQVVKDKVVLSYRLKDLDSLSRSSQELLTLKGLTAEERKMGIQYLAWVAEIRMNFREALDYMAQMKPAAKELPDYYFKMAMLRELAHQNPTIEYTQFLGVSHDREKRQYAAHQIVINSKRPLSDFNRYESLLSGNKELYRSAGIFIYEKSNDRKFAQHLLSRSYFRNSPEGLLISHQFAFQDFQNLKKKIAQSRLRPGSDAKLRRELDQRVRMLKRVESLANQTIRQKDTSQQLVYLAQLAEENSRLANEILDLPLPRGLKAQERQQYQAQVQSLVQPYRNQSQAIQAKTQEIWKQAMDRNTFRSLYEWSIQREKPGCQLAAQEVAVLRASARQSGLAMDPFGNLTEQRQKVASEAESLRQRIQKNPFDFEDLEKMKNLQMTLGSGPMVAYLDQRMNELRARGSRD